VSTAFSRARRTLEGDGFGRPLAGLLLALILLAGWSSWFFRSQVDRFEVSDVARLEVERASHVLQSPVDGRVTVSRLALGREVAPDDVLLELDASAEHLQLQEEQVRLASIPAQVAALRAEIEAAEQARRDEQQASVAAGDQARAQHREADAGAQFAEQDADRLRRLRADGLIPERDYVRARAEAQSRRAGADSFQAALARLAGEQRTREADREVRLRQIQEQITRLDALRAASAAAIDKLRYEIERRVVRAPIGGRLGEVEIVRAGSVVSEGDKLCSIVPSGEVKVVAEFPPQSAIGRVRPGQSARLRLDGFPWMQYGSLSATVQSVGNEVRGGRVRVELTIKPDTKSVIPIQHGLPGSVEIQIERISPATLALRTAGRLIAAPTAVLASGTRPAVP
jgi:membrane fusion protein (multidrug efflux system)